MSISSTFYVPLFCMEANRAAFSSYVSALYCLVPNFFYKKRVRKMLIKLTVGVRLWKEDYGQFAEVFTMGFLNFIARRNYHDNGKENNKQETFNTNLNIFLKSNNNFFYLGPSLMKF